MSWLIGGLLGAGLGLVWFCVLRLSRSDGASAGSCQLCAGAARSATPHAECERIKESFCKKGEYIERTR